jgi:antitoxin (DNA-binding transcriptional repressor) of toxin-antitoxin stability system
VIRLNVGEAKTHLSRYLKRVEAGETLVLCRRNRPIAEVRPICEAPRQGQREFGLNEGKFTIPPEFFEPLPAGMLHFFTGKRE